MAVPVARTHLNLNELTGAESCELGDLPHSKHAHAVFHNLGLRAVAEGLVLEV